MFFGLCILLCYSSSVQLALLSHPRLQQLQWLEGRVARECKQTLSPLPLFPLGKLSKQADVGFSPNPSVTGTPACPDA